LSDGAGWVAGIRSKGPLTDEKQDVTADNSYENMVSHSEILLSIYLSVDTM